MFDIGGWEFLLIAILAVIVIGPKELPGAIRTVSMFMRRARELAREFQSGIEEVARESELDKMTQGLKDAADPAGGIRRRIGEAVDPDWRDDDLIDFSGDYDDENRIQPPAPPKTAPPDAQQVEPSGAGEKTETDAPSTARPSDTAGQAADGKPGNAS